jgi:hypothetical protein
MGAKDRTFAMRYLYVIQERTSSAPHDVTGFLDATCALLSPVIGASAAPEGNEVATVRAQHVSTQETWWTMTMIETLLAVFGGRKRKRHNLPAWAAQKAVKRQKTNG